MRVFLGETIFLGTDISIPPDSYNLGAGVQLLQDNAPAHPSYVVVMASATECSFSPSLSDLSFPKADMFRSH